MGFGWISTHGSGKGSDTITSGIEGAWTSNPIAWDNGYFDLLLGYEWELTKAQLARIFGMPLILRQMIWHLTLRIPQLKFRL